MDGDPKAENKANEELDAENKSNVMNNSSEAAEVILENRADEISAPMESVEEELNNYTITRSSRISWLYD